MGDKIKREARRGTEITRGLVDPTTGIKKDLRTRSSQAIEPRKGTTSKVREAKTLAAQQQQTEAIRLAESESEVATRRASALTGRFGRRSLIKSSPTGLALNLGGTTGG